MSHTEKKNKSILSIYDTFNRRVNKIFSKLSGILILVIAVLIFQDVIQRYVFNSPTSWSLDLSGFLLVYIVFLSLSPTLESGQHVSVDLLNEVVSPKMKKIFKNIVLLLVIAFGVIFFWKILEYTIQVAQDQRISTSNIPIPLIYVYLIAPIGIFQFILTAINMYLNSMFRHETI